MSLLRSDITKQHSTQIQAQGFQILLADLPRTSCYADGQVKLTNGKGVSYIFAFTYMEALEMN